MNELRQIDSKDETCKDPVCIETISLTLYVNPTVAPFSFFRAQENLIRMRSVLSGEARDIFQGWNLEFIAAVLLY